MASSSRSRFQAFGFGLYPVESVRAVQLAMQIADRRELHDRVANILPHKSPATRARLAHKILQRHIPSVGRTVVRSPYVRLVAGAKNRATLCELLYWRTAASDSLVRAIAANILFPYLIEGGCPKEYEPAEFRLLNDEGLFQLERWIARTFVFHHAGHAWGFHSRASVRHALSILREAGIVEAKRLADLPHHPVVYTRAERPAGVVAFTFCLHEEVLGSGKGGGLSMKSVRSSKTAKTFVLRPDEVSYLLESAARHRLVRLQPPSRRSAVMLTYSNLDALVDELLNRGV